MATKAPKSLIFIAVGVVVIGGFFITHHNTSVNPSTSKAKAHSPFDVSSTDTNNETLKSIAVTTSSNRKNIEKTNRAFTNKTSELVNEISELKSQVASLRDDMTNVHQDVPEHHENHEAQNTQANTDTPRVQQQRLGQDQVINLDDSSTPQESGSPTEPSTHDGAPILPSNVKGMSKAHKDTQEPVFEIPDGATVANTVLLSPLIGEVPVGGSLKQPAFPFKAMISYKDTKDMFAANNVPLPSGIVGSVIQGISVGSMSLGCTRAYVTKMLFVFDDGRFVSYPSKSTGKDEINDKEVYPNNAIGYLSDQYNNPCISGTYVTDAPRVIGSLATLGGIAGAGNAIASSQTQQISDATTGKTGSLFTGSLGKFALGYAAGNGSQEALNWYKARVNDIFDAIFVPSSVHHTPTRLIFNVTKTIKLDINKNTGRLYHEKATSFSAVDHSVL